MKKFLILAVLTLLCSFANAKDLYARPLDATADSVIIRGRMYRLWGIKAVPGNWGKIARLVLLQMCLGKEIKFLEDVKHPGTLRFGAFDRQGKPQINAALQLLRMGLAFCEPSDLPKDETLNSRFRAAQREAQSLKLGIWSE